MSKTVKDSLNESAVPTSTLSLMKNVNHINNLWSIMNNTTSSTGDGVEAERSVILVALDIISDFSKNTKLEAVADVSQALIIGHRLVKNLDIYWDYRDFNEVVDTNGNKAFYNKGLIPKNVIADVMADVVTLSKTIGEVVADIRKIAGKLVTPASLAMDVVSTLFTVISNTIASTITAHEKLGLNAEVYLNLTKEQKEALQQQWADDERFSIHKDEFSFGELFGKAFLTALTSWSTLTGSEPIVMPEPVLPITPTPDPITVGKRYVGKLGADDIVGDDKANTMNGLTGDDVLSGGRGNDTLIGGFGHDTLIGGLDNDLLIGGYGNDTYLYHKGDGLDTIRDVGGLDILKISGLTLSDLGFAKQGNHLFIDVKQNDDGIIIEDYFKSGSIIPSQKSPPNIERIYINDKFVGHDEIIKMADVII